ncbi:uncharacterized protein MONOS_3743 [Monocercomonoides exilis]|uniref:uncharacterized protein n=1 Tax=Monocercomonoides exilis TaxID=2049356 RepID=UPI003559BD43|nr:hypothetical protein MONOS_3743 [Monocercomonoides exilis]|eukprot:MONOS_3743.1-p1 / transcript=MONOS_3743.1 / gene=MONOS_3743 / organism=Monocercomonoides_exilis_PA203 / gene_product=unspecified product / transcript_product=unspecified product / location=Mono_scaffold00091:46665-47216(-) / protein_length=69 / sequence_SO=supercontig / SO=protein_coding / is_pseudo=false
MVTMGKMNIDDFLRAGAVDFIASGMNQLTLESVRDKLKEGGKMHVPAKPSDARSMKELLLFLYDEHEK